MATQLGIYNNALRFLGETKLSALSDDRDSRFTMDDVWADSFVNKVLEQGYWYFAKRSAQFNSDPLVKPPYGLAKAFEQPSDWVRTAAVCSDPYYNVPITAFADEAGFWFTDIDPIYVSYISNDAKYGNNLAIWPETFNEFAGAYMAYKVGAKTTSSEEKVTMLEKNQRRLLIEARSKAAMNESASFLPMGSWTRSRIGRNAGGFDRGSRTSLIG